MKNWSKNLKTLAQIAMKINLQKYSEYKDSGVEWLGEIPSHWQLIKLRNIGIFSASGIDKYLKINEPAVKIINFTDVYANKSMTLDSSFDYMVVTTPESNRVRHLVNMGDLIFLPSSETYEDLGAAALVNEKLENTSFSYHVIRFVFQKDIDHSFRKYLTNNDFVLNQFSRQGKGSTRKIVGRGVFKDVQVIIPSREEQTVIANFLDRKTALIDQAVDIKQKQIELLKERRQILIHKAVTRGLNPNAKLKDSGVEWIGKIPEGWEVSKLLGLCNFIRGNSSFGKDELLNFGEYVALQYGKTYKVNEVNEQYNYYVNNEFYKADQIVNYGDTIIISTSETIQDLGHTAYYKRNDLGLIGGEQILLNPNKEKINSHYLYFASKVFSKELRKYATGIKVFRFNINDLKTIYSAVPPLSEQQQIVKYIETATAKIATAISLKQQEIEKLKEYKATLINSAVTGKIKISNYAK